MHRSLGPFDYLAGQAVGVGRRVELVLGGAGDGSFFCSEAPTGDIFLD